MPIHCQCLTMPPEHTWAFAVDLAAGLDPTPWANGHTRNVLRLWGLEAAAADGVAPTAAAMVTDVVQQGRQLAPDPEFLGLRLVLYRTLAAHTRLSNLVHGRPEAVGNDVPPSDPDTRLVVYPSVQWGACPYHWRQAEWHVIPLHHNAS